MANLVEVIHNDILQSLSEDTLTLPTLPEVALRVREVAEDPEADIAQLTHTISQDTALTARILKISNSPLFRAHQEIGDLTHAISRLGMNYTANLAVGLAMEQMFQATSDLIEERMRHNWQTTTQVAIYAAILSKRTDISPDEATLAALLHRIGVLPILSYVEEREPAGMDGIHLDKLITHLHPRLGTVILQRWHFPEALVEVPKAYRTLSPIKGRITHADLITAANLLMSADQSNSFGRADWHKAPVIEALNLPADRDHDVIQSIHAEVADYKGLF